jgi:hypothetical protein
MSDESALVVEYRRERRRIERICEWYGWMARERVNHHCPVGKVCEECDVFRELHELLFHFEEEDGGD